MIDSFLTSVGWGEVLMETRYEHIVLDEECILSIAGTTMKVVELVGE